MSMPSQFKSKALVVLLENIEPLMGIKYEPEIVEITIDDILGSSDEDEEIISDIDDDSESVETQVFVQTENIPFIKTEIENLDKTKDTSDGNLSVEEVQDSKKHFNVLTNRTDKELVLNFSEHLNNNNAKHPEKTNFSEFYKTVETTSWEKDKEKRKVTEIPMFPVKPHEYTTLTKDKHACNKNKSTEKTKAKMDNQRLKYLCDKCKYKTFRHQHLKMHKLIHLQPQEIPYFYCYHCLYKSKHRCHLKVHIFRHFKNEVVPFHCYICDFVTLKRNLIIEHFKKHPKHHSKCDETDYKNQLEIPDFYCYHCSYNSKRKDSLKFHIFRHFKREEIPFHCYICNFVTLKRDLIIKHFKKHPKHHIKCDKADYKNQLEIYTKKQMSYSCKKCSFKTYYPNNLKRHELTHKTKAKMDDRRFKYCCDKCKFRTFWPDSLKRHKVIHLKPEETQYFYCYHCSYQSNSKQVLKRHICTHFKNEEIKFHCYICNFMTLKREEIVEHFKKHPKHHSKCHERDYKNQLETYTKKQTRYSCKKCLFRTCNYERLKLHELTHKTEAKMDDRHFKYRCDKCKFRTFWPHSFKRHELIHLKSKQIQYFYCYHCSYRSNSKQVLKRHICTHFKNEEVKFHCYICNFMTLKREEIVEHFKKHPKHHSKCDETDYKNQLETYTKKQTRYNRHFKYRCDKCKYKTFRHQAFKRHKLIHLKPEEIQYFYCYHCSYKSKYKEQLKRHIYRHFKNEEIKFYCYICNFMTLKRKSITGHIKKHSKVRIKSEIHKGTFQ